MSQDAFKAAERRFQLLTVLMGGGRPTVEELARRFGVTTRSIYRDIQFLENQRIPILREDGRVGVLDTFKVKPVQFQADEVLALMAALDFGLRKLPLGGKAARSAKEKLLAVLPSQQQALASGLDSTLVVDPVPARSLPALPQVEAALQTALEHSLTVRLLYQALEADEPTERLVDPYGMAYRGTALYLIGFCQLRQGIRIFRVNRIIMATVESRTFPRPTDFDLEQYLAGIWGIEYGPLMQVRIRFDRQVARLAKETVWHPSQRVEEADDGAVILQMETRGTNELARWLAGYGATVEVLEPVALREAVLALGQGIVARYQRQEAGCT